MRLSVTLGGHTYQFRDVREVMGKANDEKSGDMLAGVAAETPQALAMSFSVTNTVPPRRL